MDNVYSILEELGISYAKHEHEAVFTVEEANKLYDDIPGAHTKNLFLRNKDSSQYYLFIIESHKRADLKGIADLLSEKKLHFGNPQELKEYLGLEPGSVSALGLINDPEHRVKVLIDKDIWDSEQVNAHPNTNTATLTFSQADFHSFIEHIGHEVTFVDCL